MLFAPFNPYIESRVVLGRFGAVFFYWAVAHPLWEHHFQVQMPLDKRWNDRYGLMSETVLNERNSRDSRTLLWRNMMRKVIYGLSLDDNEITRKLSNEALLKTFERSMEFTKSAAKILSGMKTSSISPNNISSCIEAAYQVASRGYEYGTSWGKEVGWIYGSTTEDVLTGLTIHGRGWRSAYCSPDPPAFLGCATPTSSKYANIWPTCGLYCGAYDPFQSYFMLFCQPIVSSPTHISCPR
ncbi:hypothetical protein HYC85_012072 [Camellia sinensis]|uniref:Uncharacterized protein n=1 Tax=Camellia sinensis TaxID=4442 RepID=A0A7J7HBF5_CAMSI|nr:hypothetical protein HYC85_012072 [Camellia sinensis]